LLHQCYQSRSGEVEAGNQRRNSSAPSSLLASTASLLQALVDFSAKALGVDAALKDHAAPSKEREMKPRNV